MVEQQNLTDIILRATGSGAVRSHLAHLYSSDPRHAEFYAEYLLAGELIGQPESPVGLLLAEMADLDLVFTHQFAVADGDKLLCISQLSKAPLPKSTYLLLWAPCSDGFDNGTAMAAIARLKALIVMTLGRGVLIDKIAEFVVNAGAEGGLSFPGPAFRMPQASDRKAFADKDILKELFAHLGAATEPHRTRILSALETVGRAVLESNEVYAFMLYWIGLEQLAGGTAKEVCAQLATAYGVDREYVQTHLRLREISKQRNAFIHEGVRPDLDHTVERLMQALALDLLRMRIGLPCRRLAQAIAV